MIYNKNIKLIFLSTLYFLNFNCLSANLNDTLNDLETEIWANKIKGSLDPLYLSLITSQRQKSLEKAGMSSSYWKLKEICLNPRDKVHERFNAPNQIFITENRIHFLSNDVKNILKNLFFEKNLDWCDCNNANSVTRITLIKFLIQDINRNIPKESPIIYLSFGSGKLLQDYLTIKELIRNGYRFFKIILIDPMYSQKINLDNFVLKFKNKIENFITESFGDSLPRAQFQLYTFSSLKSYLLQCQLNSTFKANVFTMLDSESSMSELLLENQNPPDLINFSICFNTNEFARPITQDTLFNYFNPSKIDLANPNKILDLTIINFPNPILFFSKKWTEPITYSHLSEECKKDFLIKMEEIENSLKESISKILAEPNTIPYQDKARRIITTIDNILLWQFNFTKDVIANMFPLYKKSLSNDNSNLLYGTWTGKTNPFVFFFPKIMELTGAKIGCILSKNDFDNIINPTQESLNALEPAELPKGGIYSFFLERREEDRLYKLKQQAEKEIRRNSRPIKIEKPKKTIDFSMLRKTKSIT